MEAGVWYDSRSERSLQDAWRITRHDNVSRQTFYWPSKQVKFSYDKICQLVGGRMYDRGT